MEQIIISNENNILHISNNEYTVSYTIYNNKGHSLDGGILESSNSKFDSDKVAAEIILMIQEQFDFSEPFIHLNGEMANNLLELIEMEDYKNSKRKVRNFLSSVKDKSDLLNNEMELSK